MILPEWENMCDAVMSKKSVTFRQIIARPTSTFWQHQLTKARVTSLLEVAAMEAPITGIGIDGTAAAIQLKLPRVFGIGTDEAMKPFAYLWIANKNLKICQEEGCSMLLMHGLATEPGLVQIYNWALSLQHLCEAGQAEHQACGPVVTATWRHARLKVPTVCDMVTVCPPWLTRPATDENSRQGLRQHGAKVRGTTSW